MFNISASKNSSTWENRVGDGIYLLIYVFNENICTIDNDLHFYFSYWAVDFELLYRLDMFLSYWIYFIITFTIRGKFVMGNTIQDYYHLELNTEFRYNETLLDIVPVSSEYQCSFMCSNNELCCTTTFDDTTKICVLDSCCYPLTKYSNGKVLMRNKEKSGKFTKCLVYT